MIRLGVNVDHVATVRQARLGQLPDPVEAAIVAEQAGAGGITVHLREDRRHIQEQDVQRLRERLQTQLNLEMAVTPAMVAFAEKSKPDHACFVPESREELTTEGGLDVVVHREKIGQAVERLQNAGIQVSLFVDPEPVQIEASKQAGAKAVEIHTGRYCGASPAERADELKTIIAAAQLAESLNLEVHAGHGLDYENVVAIAAIPQIVELNIGHSIIARAIMVGIESAVRQMRELLKSATRK
jgi:pyridoxine 5-phosphate synthase